MKFFLVLGVILLLFFLISLVRVGGDLVFGEAGFFLKLRLGRFHFALYPMKPKKEKPKKEKQRKFKPKPKAAPPKPGPKVNTWALLREMLPVATEAAGHFKNKVRIDRLNMDLTVAAGDPATAAVAYGAANAFIGMMIPVLENNFKMKGRNLRTRVDFNRTSPAVELATAFSLTIGQGVALSSYFCVRALKAYMSRNNAQK